MASANTGIGSLAPGHYGAPDAGLAIGEATLAGAWNVQGDAAQSPFAKQVRQLFELALPVAPNTTARNDTLTAYWIGPASWLLVAGGSSALVDFAGKRDAVTATGGALFDVSATRVAYTVAGTLAPAVLAAGCPLDFHPHAFAVGTCRQSLFGHIAALIEKRDDTPTFMLLVARSFARDAWHSLCLSSAEYGYEVRAPAPLL